VFQIKRIYEPADSDDGARVLVDRLWPRGVSKQKAHLDLWMKEIAPSDSLRKWFAHDPARWTEFVSRYRQEFRKNRALAGELKRIEKARGKVTLLYSAHDEQHNQAVALLQFLKGSGSD